MRLTLKGQRETMVAALCGSWWKVVEEEGLPQAQVHSSRVAFWKWVEL